MANPQAWNRYSYVLNNPINAFDPSGHKCVGEPDECLKDDGSKGAGFTGGSNNSSKNKECGPGQRSCLGVLDEQFADMFTGENDLGLVDSWIGPKDLDPAEWEELLMKIADNIHDTSKIKLLFKARNFDTPFFDRGGFFGIGKLSGTGCLNGKCYDRAEINYVLQGMLWARIGVSKEEGHLIVYEWKQSKVLFNLMTPMPVSVGTIEMFDAGYDYYDELYSTTP